MDKQVQRELQVTKLLGMYQMVEFSLKVYIACAYAMIRDKLNGLIPFDFRYKDIEQTPLGKINGIFGKLNKNTDLQKKLKKLTKHRNYIAHRAIVEQNDVIRDVLDIDVSEEPIDMNAAEVEVDNCLLLIAKELETIFNFENADETKTQKQY